MKTPLLVRFRNAEITDLDEQVREIDSPIVMGRSRDVDVMLADPGVSRRHATFRRDERGEWLIEDLHSTRGTWLNGRRLQPGESAVVRPGDLIEVRPWSLLISSPAQTTGQILSPSHTVGTIADAVAAPFLRERFDSLMSAVQRSTTLAGEEEIFGALLESLLDASDLDRAMILRIEGEDARALSLRAREREDEINPRSFSRTLVNAALDREGTVRMEESPDVSSAASIIASGAGEALSRAIRGDASVQDVLYADRRESRGEDPELVAWFDAVGSLAEVALRIRRGRLAETERARMAAEMDSARAVQEVLLPESEGRIGNLSWSSIAIPGVQIAGDLLDVRQLGDDLHLVLGDVSGKGARAGLVMAGTQACADALVSAGLGPGELVARLDDWAIRHTPDDVFVTLWCGRVNADGTVRYMDAGHGHMLVCRADGSLEHPTGHGRLPLGIEAVETEEALLQLEPGDSLLVFSDGVVEQPGPEDPNDRFGDDRLAETIAAHGPEPKAIHEALVAWCGTDGLDDDLTILRIRRES